MPSTAAAKLSSLCGRLSSGGQGQPVLCFCEGITHQKGKEACTTLQVPTAEDLASLPPLASAEARRNAIRYQGERKQTMWIVGMRFVRCPDGHGLPNMPHKDATEGRQNATRQADPDFAGYTHVYHAQRRATWATASQNRSEKFSPLYRKRWWVDGVDSQSFDACECDCP